MGTALKDRLGRYITLLGCLVLVCGACGDPQQREIPVVPGSWRVADLDQLARLRLVKIDAALTGASPELSEAIGSVEAADLARRWPKLDQEEKLAEVRTWLSEDEITFTFAEDGSCRVRRHAQGGGYEESPCRWRLEGARLRVEAKGDPQLDLVLSATLLGNRTFVVVEPSDFRDLVFRRVE